MRSHCLRMRYFIDYIFIGGGVMKNKRVKQMICKFYDKKHNSFAPYFGHYFTSEGFFHCFPGGYGPDCYYDDFEKVELGVISLTANQLNGKKE